MKNIYELVAENNIAVEKNDDGNWMFFRGTETNEVEYNYEYEATIAALEFFGLIPPTDEGDDLEEWEPEEYDPFRDDVEADADALAQIGWGTDEDYGYYGD